MPGCWRTPRVRHAWAAVAAFAFAEASFFPIPADVMVLPMMLADRSPRLPAGRLGRLLVGGRRHAGLCHRPLFWETAGLWLIHVLHVPLERVEALRLKYTQHAYLIMVQGATPIPYKLVTIASGLAGVSFPLFMLYSAVTRSIRYIVIEGAAGSFLRRTGAGAAGEISRSRAGRVSYRAGAGVCCAEISLSSTCHSAKRRVCGARAGTQLHSWIPGLRRIIACCAAPGMTAPNPVPVRWRSSNRPKPARLRPRPARPAAWQADRRWFRRWTSAARLFWRHASGRAHAWRRRG